MKILLSEGCPIYRTGMHTVLTIEGHEVYEAHTIDEFSKEYSSKYDVIIMDLDILGTIGIEMARKNDAAMNYYNSHPTKLIATYSNPSESLKAYLFAAMIKKPFQKEKLLSIINKEDQHVKRFNYKTNRNIIGHNYAHSMV